MTSTNDEKEVKSNQTSGPKGKSYFIELYKSLESRLSEGGSPHERTAHLCEAWRRVHSLCQHSAPSTHSHLLSWLQRHTARAVLQTEWQSLKRKEDRALLEEAINVFIVESRTAAVARDGVSPPWEAQLVARGEWFKRVLDNPWKHPVLNCLLNPDGTPPTNDEVLEWLKDERGVTFVMRLHTLVAEKCDDIAVSLATAVMERVRADCAPVSDIELAEEPKDKTETRAPNFGDRLRDEAGFTVDVWEMLTDIEFVLLHKRDSSKCINLAKQTPLRGAYQLIERLQSRLDTSPREKRLWKNSKEVAVLLAQVVIARCMVVPVCGGAARSALYCCARSLARLMGGARLPGAACALAAPAPTAAHLHTLAAAIDAHRAQKNDASMLPFVCELYVRAITAGMNELERLKLKTEKDTEARSMEQTLSSWFVQLGAVLACSDRVKCECALTAFSVHPSPHMYERIKAAPALPVVQLDTEDSSDLTQAPNAEFGSWASDSRSMTNFVKTSETLNMKARQNQANVLSTAILNEGEALGLSPELCQDITVLLSGPRVKTLSWDMDRELLLENCRAYMERTHGGTKALTTDLKYLNLNPADFQHLPEEDDDENNIYYGIEKGYEHLVEFQEPEDIWEDALHDLETAQTSSTDEYMEEKPQRRKKNKRIVSDTKMVPTLPNSDGDSDPLSLVAEAKRSEKKHRTHSKERSHKKKEKTLLTDPLDLNETTEKKPKEKKERKKKEKPPKPETDGSLSSLIGLKVVKKKSSKAKKAAGFEGTINSEDVVKSRNDSQSSDSVGFMFDSRAHGKGVQMNQFSRPHRPPSISSVRTQSPSDHSRNNSPTFVSEEVKQTLTKLLEFRRQKAEAERKTPSAIIRPGSPKVGEKDKISPKSVVIPEIPKSYINKQQSDRLQELKEKVDSILLARRQAIPSPVIQYATKTRASPNTQSYYNQYNYERTMDVNSSASYNMFDRAKDNVTPSPAHNYNRTRNMTPSPAHSLDRTRNMTPSPSHSLDRARNMTPSPAHSVDRTRNMTPSPHSTDRTRNTILSPTHSLDRMRNMTPSPAHSIDRTRNMTPSHSHSIDRPRNAPTPAERFMENVNYVSIYDKNSPSHSESSPYMPQDRNTKQNNNYQEFLNKFFDSINTSNHDSDNKQPPKKEMRPISRVTPVVPNIPKTSPSAKAMPQKKPDGSLNTFSRLSYYKNKQTDMRKSNESQNTVGAKLEGFILNHLIHCQSSNDRSRASSPKEELKQIRPNSKQTNAKEQHPTLTNMLQSKNTASNQQQKPTSVSPPKSTLSENDQHDLLRLLRQQNIMNKPFQNSPTASSSKNFTPSTDSNYNTIPNDLFNDQSTSKTNENENHKAGFAVNVPSSMRSVLKINNSKLLNTKKPPEAHGKSIKIEVNKAPSKKTVTKPQVPVPPPKNPTEWESVMNNLLKHKTPFRGPNALDMTLKNTSFEKAFMESLRNPPNLFPPDVIPAENPTIRTTKHADSSSSNTVQNVKNNTQPLNIEKQSKPENYSKSKKINDDRSKKLMNRNQIEDTNNGKQVNIAVGARKAKSTKIETPRMVVQQPLAIPKKIQKPDITNVPRKFPEVVHKKPFNNPEPKDDISARIPKSDYDLLDELMDDDLRKEIGELSSDEESYSTAAQNYLKDTKTNDQKRVNVVFNQPITKIVSNIQTVPSPCQQVCKNESAQFAQMTIQPQPTRTIPVPSKSKLVQPRPIIEKTKHVTQITNHPLYIAAMSQQTQVQNEVIGSDLVYDGYTPVQPSVQNVMNIAQNYMTIDSAPNVNLYPTQFTVPVVMTSPLSVPVTSGPCPPTVVQSNPIATIKQSVNSNATEPHPPLQNQTPAKDKTPINPNELEPPQVKGKYLIENDIRIILEKTPIDIPKPETQAFIDTNIHKNNERKVLIEVQEKHTAEKNDCKRRNQNVNNDLKEHPVSNQVKLDQERVKKKRMAILNREITHFCGIEPIALGYSPLHSAHKEDKELNLDKQKEVYSIISENNLQELSEVRSPATPDSCKENKSDHVQYRRILLRSSNKLKIHASSSMSSKSPLDKKSKHKSAVSVDTPNDIPGEVDQSDTEIKNKPKRLSKRIRNKSLIAPKDSQGPTNVQSSPVATDIECKLDKAQDKQPLTPKANEIPIKSKLNKLTVNIEKLVVNQDNANDQLLDIESELLGSTILKKSSITLLSPEVESEEKEKSLNFGQEVDNSKHNEVRTQQVDTSSDKVPTKSQEQLELLENTSESTAMAENEMHAYIENSQPIQMNIDKEADVTVAETNVIINQKDKIMNETGAKDIFKSNKKPCKTVHSISFISDANDKSDKDSRELLLIENTSEDRICVNEITTAQPENNKRTQDQNQTNIQVEDDDDIQIIEDMPKSTPKTLNKLVNESSSIQDLPEVVMGYPLEKTKPANNLPGDSVLSTKDKLQPLDENIPLLTNVPKSSPKQPEQKINENFTMKNQLNNVVVEQSETTLLQKPKGNDIKIMENKLIPKHPVKIADKNVAAKDFTKAVPVELEDDDIQIIEDSPKHNLNVPVKINDHNKAYKDKPTVVGNQQTKNQAPMSQNNPTANSEIKYLADSIIIENLSIDDNPTKKVVRVTHPNGKTFTGIVKGPVNVETLLHDPKLRLLLSNHFQQPKNRYTLKLNVSKVSNSKGEILSQEVSSQEPVETVDLLSDNEEEAPQMFETFHGKYKVKSMDNDTFTKHQNQLKKKCYVPLKKIILEQVKRNQLVSTTNLIKTCITPPHGEELVKPDAAIKPLPGVVDEPKLLPVIPEKYVKGIFSDIEDILGPVDKQTIEDNVVLIDDSSNDSVDLPKTSKPTEKIDELKNMLLKDLGVNQKILPLQNAPNEDVQVTWSTEAIDLTDDTPDRIVTSADLENVEYQKIIDRKCFVKLVRCDDKVNKHKRIETHLQPVSVEVDAAVSKSDDNVISNECLVPAPVSRSGSFSLLEDFPINADIDTKDKESDRSSPVMEIYDVIASLEKLSIPYKTCQSVGSFKCEAEWATSKRVNHITEKSLNEHVWKQCYDLLTEIESIEDLTKFYLSSKTIEVPRLTHLILTCIQNGDLITRLVNMRKINSTCLKRKSDLFYSTPNVKISKIDNCTTELQMNNSLSPTVELDLSTTDASYITTADHNEDIDIVPENEAMIDDIDVTPDLSITSVSDHSDIEDNTSLPKNGTEQERDEVCDSDNATATAIVVGDILNNCIDNAVMICNVEIFQEDSIEEQLTVKESADISEESNSIIVEHIPFVCSDVEIEEKYECFVSDLPKMDEASKVEKEESIIKTTVTLPNIILDRHEAVSKLDELLTEICNKQSAIDTEIFVQNKSPIEVVKRFVVDESSNLDKGHFDECHADCVKEAKSIEHIENTSEGKFFDHIDVISSVEKFVDDGEALEDVNIEKLIENKVINPIIDNVQTDCDSATNVGEVLDESAILEKDQYKKTHDDCPVLKNELIKLTENKFDAIDIDDKQTDCEKLIHNDEDSEASMNEITDEDCISMDVSIENSTAKTDCESSINVDVFKALMNENIKDKCVSMDIYIESTNVETDCESSVDLNETLLGKGNDDFVSTDILIESPENNTDSNVDTDCKSSLNVAEDTKELLYDVTYPEQESHDSDDNHHGESHDDCADTVKHCENANNITHIDDEETDCESLVHVDEDTLVEVLSDEISYVVDKNTVNEEVELSNINDGQSDNEFSINAREDRNSETCSAAELTRVIIVCDDPDSLIVDIDATEIKRLLSAQMNNDNHCIVGDPSGINNLETKPAFEKNKVNAVVKYNITIPSTLSVMPSDSDLTLIIPKKTYARSLDNDDGEINRLLLKRKKDMSDYKTSEKKYRKGKNIDYPKITATAMAETHYGKKFKQLIDYCSSVKFSYALPFHIEDIDMDDLLQDRSNQDCHIGEVNDSDDVENLLFVDTEDSENVKTIDPLQQSLNEEIENGHNIKHYEPIEINETNFSMGFGEMSGRVIQDIGNGITELSAATLSDVKQFQPLSLSENKQKNQNYGRETDNQRDKLLHFMRHISLKEKVQSFFKKTAFDLTSDQSLNKRHDPVKERLSRFPFGLTSTQYMTVPQKETIVNVVQVGQLPVSASAQNPITCDPRVTHVVDASPSRCSDNSASDSQSAIETEYTELTTADITPIVQEYAHHHQSPQTQEYSSSNADDDIDGTTRTMSVVKIELIEESSQEKVQDMYGCDFSPMPNNNVEYSFDDAPNTIFNSTNNSDNSVNMQKTSDSVFSTPTNVNTNFTEIFNASDDSNMTYTNLENSAPENMDSTSADNNSTLMYNSSAIAENGSTETYATSLSGNSTTELENSSEMYKNTYTDMDNASSYVHTTPTIVNNSNVKNSPDDKNTTRMDSNFDNVYSTSPTMSSHNSNDIDENTRTSSSNIDNDPINMENGSITSNSNRENTDYEYNYENYDTSIDNNNADVNGVDNYVSNVDSYAANSSSNNYNGSDYKTNVGNYPLSVDDYGTNVENYTNNVERYTAASENFTTNVENYHADDDYTTNSENSAAKSDSNIDKTTRPSGEMLEKPQDLTIPSTQESKERRTYGEHIVENHQEKTSDKRDRIAHAMSAAGITSETVVTTGTDELDSLISQSSQSGTFAATSNNYPKPAAPIGVMTLQQALSQVLPPPLNPTGASENNQGPPVLHIVQGNNAQNVNKSNGTHLIHLVRNKTPGSNGLSLVDSGLQQGGNQLIHIVNNGNPNSGQFLKRVNLLTNLAQGSNEQKMIQFVCKSADGKSIQLNAGHQQSMVLRLHPTAVQTASKPTEPQDLPASTSTQKSVSHEAAQQEIKSRSVYEENYAQFIQSSSTPGQHSITSNPHLTSPGQHTPSPDQEKGTSLPKFNQVFGKQSYQDNPTEINHASLPENTSCQAEENNHIEPQPESSSPPLLVRTTVPETTQAQANVAQPIKQTISPMTMHGGVIYTRQIPVNLGGGKTINLITVPSTELVDDSPQKQAEGNFRNQEEHSSIIKLVPHHTSSPNVTVEDNSPQPGASNEPSQNPQPQPVLTQMRIKLPMLSKGPHIVPGARLVRPSFFQIQRNVIAGTNQPVYQQLVLTAAPSLGQTIRLPGSAQQVSQQPSPRAQASQQTHQPILIQTQSAQQPQVSSPQTKPDKPESELSTLTLEQLREFDMVLEQVKERSIVNVNPIPSFPTCPKPVEMPSADSTDASATTTSVTESTQEVLYSVDSNQPANVVSYVNRKSTITSATTSYVRSPDSSGIIDAPSSSTQVQITHTVTQKTTDGHSSDTPRPKKKKKKSSSSSSRTLAALNNSPSKTSTLKPQEDEQTTQRILYILAEYKEQVENCPDKNKPAPRRRNQFPPSTGSKRKRGHCSSRSSCKRESSPVGDNGDDSLITLGSEDSSCGTEFSECTDCQDSHSPEGKVVRRLTFEQETTTQTITQTRTHTIPQRNVIVNDGQTITVARTTTTANTNTKSPAPATTTLLMPANYLLPVSMIKGGQQIAIMTNRGPRLLVGAGEGNSSGALLFQRLIGPGLKPVLARPGVRHIRLPTTALQNLQSFNIQTPVTPVQPPDSTAPPPAPGPPDLVDTRAMSSPWEDREAQDKPERGSSPDCTEPWNLPSSSIAEDYGYEEIVRTDNMERTVLDAIPDRYSPDMEAQRIFDKMFDVDSKKSMYSPRCGFDIDASDDDRPFQQVVQQRKDGKSHRVTHVSTAALRHKYAILEHELRLQKSLSEECEDLGVDSPSASDLFPEADILFGAPSPAHEQTIDECNTPPPIPMPPSIPQPDLDDQIATDHLLTPPTEDRHTRHDELDLNLDDVGEIVTVGEDGVATIQGINPEEFAKSHPNTTFHTEPEDSAIPFTITPSVKARHITFHAANRSAGTVVMAPQATVIAQAAVNPQNDNIMNVPNTQNIPSLVIKDTAPKPLSKFDLLDSREIPNKVPAAHGTQVIRRLRYDERNTRLVGAQRAISNETKMRNDRAIVESMGDNASSPGQPELFWDSTERNERRFQFAENEKVAKSPFDELLNDSSAYGPHTRLDSVIKAARPERTFERTSFEGLSVSGSSDESRPLRTYPPKRVHTQHTQDLERHFTLKTTTTTMHESDRMSKTSHHHELDRKKVVPRCQESEGRRRASGRGVVKRPCSCCNGSTVPPKKKSRPKKTPTDFTNS